MIFIKIRKKTLLPIKWFIKRINRERKLEVRSKKEILEEITRLKPIALDHERNEREKELLLTYGKLLGLKWVLYDRTKE